MSFVGKLVKPHIYKMRIVLINVLVLCQQITKQSTGIAVAKHVVKKSRFFGEATAIENRTLAKQFVVDVQARNRQATHYCYAYILGSDDEKLEYATDAGEPTNTAGQPILNAIRATGLTNVIVVVARYYGGINLGIGGLIRAYGACAKACLENAVLKTRTFYHKLQIKVSFHNIGTVVTLCKRFGGKVINIEYDPNPNITIRILKKDLNGFKEQIKGIETTEIG